MRILPAGIVGCNIWALATAFAFDGPALQQTIAACFERRKIPWQAEVPRCLTPTFFQTREIEPRWRGYLAAGAVLVPPSAQFEVVGEGIPRFLGSVRNGIIEGASFSSTWEPGGPWLASDATDEATP